MFGIHEKTNKAEKVDLNNSVLPGCHCTLPELEGSYGRGLVKGIFFFM